MLRSTVLTSRNSRSVYLLTAFAALLLLTTIWHLRPAPQQLRVRPIKTSDRPQTTVEIEGLSLGAPFVSTVETNATTGLGSFEHLSTALQARFARTTSDTDKYPTCSLNLARYAGTALDTGSKYIPWQRRKRDAVVSIAINLFNSEAIIPAQAIALLQAVSQLLSTNKVYVSVFENGSTDKTRELLSDFAAALQAVGVDGLWLHSSHLASPTMGEDRIVMLSEIRNLALMPLMPYALNAAGAGTLLFVNDVVTCASDVLELVHQQRLQDADMVMAMDWGTVTTHLHENDSDDAPEVEVTRLYDMWVTRGINGDLPYPFEHEAGYSPQSPHDDWVQDAFITQNESVHDRWLDGRPFPVYSAWGGMVVFDASLFAEQHLRFRSSTASGWNGGSSVGALGAWGGLLSAQGYLTSDCPGASECEYIARDIWNLRQGSARMVLAPQARTTYSVDEWSVMRGFAPTTLREDPDSKGRDLINWNEVAVPDKVVCIPTRHEDGEYIDTWDESNKRRRLNPMWQPVNGTVE
ncbi:hypothetical protein LTR27_011006 [Elasticomyces elasticus]|nr:hypothetical protein LTR27_011006 [Elasticomyces elasticus]